VLIADLERAGTAWPRFAPVARQAGFRSVNAFPLRLRDRILGALNLFDAEPRRLDQADVVAAQALADIATIGLLQYRTITDAHALARHLSAALESRIAIEQAKGVIAERLNVGMDEAFERLRRYARSRRRRLSEVAEEVVAGTLSPARSANSSSGTLRLGAASRSLTRTGGLPPAGPEFAARDPGGVRDPS
jgi:GAF domain-containing protein